MNEIEIQKLRQLAWNELLDEELEQVCDKWYRTGLSCEELGSSLVWGACVEVGLDEVEDIVAGLRAEQDADEEIEEDQDVQHKSDE